MCSFISHPGAHLRSPKPLAKASYGGQSAEVLMKADAKKIEEGEAAPMTLPGGKEKVVSANREVAPPVQKVETKAEGEHLELYAIQLITYTHEDYVNKELAKLKRNGFEPSVVRDGRFFVINVGPYKNKDEALTILKEFKRQVPYRSAFLRKLSQ